MDEVMTHEHDSYFHIGHELAAPTLKSSVAAGGRLQNNTGEGFGPATPLASE